VPIADLNAVRIALSAIKGGGLALRSVAPIVTLAVSDVIGDSLEAIGSGPTVGGWSRGQAFDLAALVGAQRSKAVRVLVRHEIAIPDVLETAIDATQPTIRTDFARVVVPMNRLARNVHAALRRELPDAWFTLSQVPFSWPVSLGAQILTNGDGKSFVAWGEATLVVPPDAGSGGRMQQLALACAKELAKHSEPSMTMSMLAIGSDGMDGPPPRDRPAPAGAFVDRTTWDAIRAAGIDPDEALRRCDAGTALAAVGALVVTGPTGINHADLVVIG
jgi:glycerate 2-kinase